MILYSKDMLFNTRESEVKEGGREAQKSNVFILHVSEFVESSNFLMIAEEFSKIRWGFDWVWDVFGGPARRNDLFLND